MDKFVIAFNYLIVIMSMDRQIFAQKNSTRHHYIPQFYTKGFTNTSGFVFVYDKQKDKVSKKEYSPKSIFFEDNRNTIVIENETSILEDKLFKELDDKCKIVIQNLRNKPNSESLLNTDNTAGIQFFILSLFWRIPKTDKIFDKYFRKAEIIFTTKDGNKVHDLIEELRLKNDSSYKKLYRAFLPGKFIKSYLEQSKETYGQYYVQLFEKSDDLFLLGDYPMAFRMPPATIDDLFQTDFYLPISSNRLFYTAKKQRELKFDFEKICNLNILIIDQSHRYVCGPDLFYLEKSVEHYKLLQKKQLLPYLRNKIFEDKIV